MAPTSDLPSASDDVRMRGFTRRVTVDAARAWIDDQSEPGRAEWISLAEAAGRVLAEDVLSGVAVPGFARAMMDGYAVQAGDTIGSTRYQPLRLTVVGQALPGRPWTGGLVSGQAVRIMTGAPLPDGANAVVPVEQTQLECPPAEAASSATGGVEFLRLLGEVPPGKHVGTVGEDILAGQRVLTAGRRLRPQDVGLLASIGVAQVVVRRRVRVRIVVTGDELVPPGTQPGKHQIVDSNSPMLQALIVRDGGVVTGSAIIADDPDEILSAMGDDVDVVLVSGGSSVGQEDHAPQLLAQHGVLAIHGIAMRPSSPTGMGRLGPRMVFLLPGNPVSCLCSYDFFAGRAIRVLGGLPRVWPYRSRQLPLRQKLVSVVGRVDYARVQIVTENAQDVVQPLAISGASLLSSTTRADGFVIIPGDREGFAPGHEVEVFLYD